MMNKVELKNMVVHNVEQCPSCDSKKYAYFNYMNILNVGCDDCAFEAKGGVKINRGVTDEDKEFKDITRMMFNHWNETVAAMKGKEFKKVMIRKKGKK